MWKKRSTDAPGPNAGVGMETAEGTPFPHGASVWRGEIYWVADIGGNAPVCRVKI